MVTIEFFYRMREQRYLKVYMMFFVRMRIIFILIYSKLKNNNIHMFNLIAALSEAFRLAQVNSF